MNARGHHIGRPALRTAAPIDILIGPAIRERRRHHTQKRFAPTMRAGADVPHSPTPPNDDPALDPLDPRRQTDYDDSPFSDALAEVSGDPDPAPAANVVASDVLSEYIAAAKYAHALPGGGVETWAESVHRTCDMHREKFASIMTDQIAGWIDEVEQAITDKEILPSMRSLQNGGPAILRREAKIMNCSASHASYPAFFREALWLLLCGCGVGFSVQRRHVVQLPGIRRPLGTVRRHVAEDSIEGWADALDALLRSYFYGDAQIEFDFSRIRAKGSPISSGIGTAPGPEPLRDALEQIRELLDARIEQGQIRLEPIDVYDIMAYAAGCVQSGGIRRSAMIVLFDIDDDDMVDAKRGDWWRENPQRSQANISAVGLRKTASHGDVKRILRGAQKWGEPGLFFSDHPDEATNPCGEISLWPLTGDGRTGFAFCNLSTINGSTVRDAEDLKRRARLAAIVGTLQAAYTRYDYLGPESQEIAEREALLGVSICGVVDNSIARDPDAQRAAVVVAKEINVQVAKAIGIRPAARITTIKPEGTASLVLGGIGSGIHAHHSPQYLRRVKLDPSTSAVDARFAEINPECVTEIDGELYGEFPIAAPAGATTTLDQTARDQLDTVASTQRAWVDPGTRPDRCAHPSLRHNVSATITVQEHEWDEVAEIVYERRHVYGGLSFLEDFGDLSYPNAPRCDVSKRDDPKRDDLKKRWIRLAEVIRYVDYGGIDHQPEHRGEVACAGGVCEI